MRFPMNLRPYPLLAVLALAVFSIFALAADPDSYAAIAYNPRNGEYWFSYGMATKETAESEVSKRAKNGDKLTVVVCKNCYCALAMSADGKGFGVGQADAPLAAQEAALKECRKKSSAKASVMFTLHTAQGIGGDSYFAIAYSPSTGRYGVSIAKASKSEAEVEAVSRCNALDAKAVASTKNACIALAVGKDKSAYGVGTAETEKDAQAMALEACKKKTTDCSIAVTLTGKK
jgi:Domain of unknown function (DUF4189)